MKSRSVAIPRAANRLHGLAGLGFVMLAAMPVSLAFADPVPAPAANQAPAAKPALAAPATPPSTPATPHPAQPEATPAPAATPAKAAPAKAPASAKSAGASLPIECVRTGQHVIANLARNDSGTANQFHNFYVAFKCPPQHLAQAFGCLVKWQTVNPGANPSEEKVKECWEDPATPPKPQPPAATAPAQ